MDKGNELRMSILKKLIEHFDYFNNLAPFPLWDTSMIEDLRKEIEMNKEDYDKEPVKCCGYCKNIHSVEDDQGNYICSKCTNIVNDEFEDFDNIYDYIEKYGDIWGIKTK